MNYIYHSLIVISAITESLCLVRIPIKITSSAIELKICPITVEIKNYKSRYKKITKRNKIVLLAKSKISSTEAWISKALIDSNISHDEFVLINNVLRKFYDIKNSVEIKIPITNKNSSYTWNNVVIVWTAEKKSKTCKD